MVKVSLLAEIRTADINKASSTTSPSGEVDRPQGEPSVSEAEGPKAPK
jgi:hypothetical protein